MSQPFGNRTIPSTKLQSRFQHSLVLPKRESWAIIPHTFHRFMPSFPCIFLLSDDLAMSGHYSRVDGAIPEVIQTIHILGWAKSKQNTLQFYLSEVQFRKTIRFLVLCGIHKIWNHVHVQCTVTLTLHQLLGSLTTGRSFDKTSKQGLFAKQPLCG